MSILDPTTLAKLDEFRVGVAALPNESAKTHAFMGLVAQLFPATDVVARLAGGIEKRVRIEAGDRRIDSYFNNAVIEFERDLDVSLDTAVAQLHEQAAGLWNGEEDPDRGLLCVASDGLRWETFRATLESPAPDGRRLGPENVHLEPMQSFKLAPGNLSTFWLWLTGLLFRDNQVLPDAERFRLDFGSSGPAYLDGIRQLRAAWGQVGGEGEAKVAFEAWRRYLAVTYGQLADSGQEIASPETVDLFLKHTFLAMIARLLVWAALSRGRAEAGLSAAIDRALDGSYFRERRIENLVESDFFQWATADRPAAILRPAWERALGLILGYDLSRLSQDVLKGVYQELVDPRDRHDLGEYYTPEWLCTRLVAEMMPESGVVSVLDPTCGSGSFLRAAIAHMVDHNLSMDKGELLAAILEGVVGIDIHPLAVTIAKATYLLALKDLMVAASRPVRIPVYLADALFLPAEVSQSLLNGREIEVRFGLDRDRKFFLPSKVLDEPGRFDEAIGVGTKAAENLARGGRETARTLQKTLQRELHPSVSADEAAELASYLWDYVEALAALIRDRQNSIWAFIIKNGYRPALLKGRFDLILGNPPWLSYRYITDPDYQAEVKKRAVDYGIAPREQKLFTQMELATIFLIHGLETFGKAGARLAFVMPRSVLTADQHEPLRDRKYAANVALTAYWDLFDVRPLFNVPSCVLFARKIAADESRGPGQPLPALVWEGRLSGRNLDWGAASGRLSSRERVGRIVNLGTRNAFTTSEHAIRGGHASPYLKGFRQGATIVPRSFYFVSLDDGGRPINPDAWYWCKTDAEQAKEAKAPYRDVFIEGNIPGSFLFLTAISRNVLPFAVIDPARVVLPLIFDDDGTHVWDAEELREDGWRNTANWMENAEKLWAFHRGQKSDRMTLGQWLDYSGKLTSQDLSAPFLVLYNAAGTNISAAVLSREDYQQTFFVDTTLYYFATTDRAEADYLAAVLNSGVVNDLIKPFQSVGLQGERHVHKKVLELPIPLFNPKKRKHAKMAALGATAAARAAEVVEVAKAGGWPAGLARRRAIVRAGLAETLAEIDRAVLALLAGDKG